MITDVVEKDAIALVELIGGRVEQPVRVERASDVHHNSLDFLKCCVVAHEVVLRHHKKSENVEAADDHPQAVQCVLGDLSIVNFENVRDFFQLFARFVRRWGSR